MGNSFSEEDLAGKNVGLFETIVQDSGHVLKDILKSTVDVVEKSVELGMDATETVVEMVVETVADATKIVVDVNRVAVKIDYKTTSGDRKTLSVEVLVPVVLSSAAVDVVVSSGGDESSVAMFKEAVAEGRVAEICNVYLTFLPFVGGSRYTVDASVVEAIYAKLFGFFGSGRLSGLESPATTLHLAGFGMASVVVYTNAMPRLGVWGLKVSTVEYDVGQGETHIIKLSESGVWTTA